MDTFGADSRQVGGDHYQGLGIHPWDYAIANGMGFMEGSVVKYVTRWHVKRHLYDLMKAKHCIEKMIEVELVKDENAPPWSEKGPVDT